MTVGIREDFRRDGLLANFLVDDRLMRLLAKSLPRSRINIGYPSICSEEEKMCRKIVNSLQDVPVETAVVSHARKIHLMKSANVISNSKNSSANFWIPVSDDFIDKTIKMSAGKVINYAKELVMYWKNELSGAPIDVALADCTSPEINLGDRINYFYEHLTKAGVRSIIICDTLGIVNSRTLDLLIKDLPKNVDNLEFHPHNDGGVALDNIAIAISHGFKYVGCSFFGMGERRTMVDPREVVRKYNVPFVQESFNEFNKNYYELIESLHENDEFFMDDVVITGTQYRLFGRGKQFSIKFGVTSDKYILAQMIGMDPKKISSEFLQKIKNTLYVTKKRTLNQQELKTLINLGMK